MTLYRRHYTGELPIACGERFGVSAITDGEKRPPLGKGEVTRCEGCGGTLNAVMPQFKAAHWRGL